MKRIYSLMSLGAAMLAMTFTGCKTEEQGGDGAITDATFTVSVISAESNSATAAVTSTNSEATWYCFYTEDLTGNVNDIVAAEVAGLSDVASVLRSGNRAVTFEGLQPKTNYRAIVTGLTSDGTVYGTPAVDEFTSGRVVGEIEENTAWEMSYGGRIVYDQTLSISDIVRCTTTDTQEGYFTMAIDKATFDEYYSGTNGMEEFIQSCVQQYQDLIDSYEGQIGWDDILIYGSTEDPYSALAAGDWYLFAIGANTDGNYTGLWARAEVNIAAPAENGDYLNYAGTWAYTLEGEQNPVIITPLGTTGSEIDGNQILNDGLGIYQVDGYQGWIDGEPFFPSIIALYDSTEGLAFMCHDVGMSVNTDAGVGSLGIFGTFTYQGQSTATDYGMGIATGELSGNQITVSGAQLYDNAGTPVATVESMQFMVFVQNSGYYSFNNPAPTFPFTLSEYQGGTSSAKAAAPKTVSRELDGKTLNGGIVTVAESYKSFRK